MPMRLNVGATKKVSDNNYGSRGASVNLEIELDSCLVMDSAKLQERSRPKSLRHKDTGPTT
jgi:hypothetical protein